MDPEVLWSKVSRYVDANADSLVEEVRRFLRMPSVSATGEGIEETAGFLRDWISERLGARVSVLRYGGHPIVYAKVDVGSPRTVVLYNMYDVQPPDPLNAWEHPPFEARVVGGRIVARGAYNTKGALMSALLGVEAFARVGSEPPVNLALVLEGEEELGSPSMPKFVEDKGGELRGAFCALFVMPSERREGKPVISLGNKGIVFVELRCRVSRYDVHSSLSRGLVNPVAALAKVISHLIDPIEGPILPWLEEKALTPLEEDLEHLDDLEEAVPLEEVVEAYGIERTRLSGREWYVAVHYRPTVNVDGIRAGHVGPGTKTILPSEAVATLDFRTVPGVEPEDVIRGLEDLVRRLGLEGLVEIRVHDCYTWSRTSPRSPAVRAARSAYARMGLRPYVVTMSPGSAPMYLFTRKLGVPAVATGPGRGGRAHAPNEYITVDTVPKVAKYVAAYLLEASSA